MLWSLHHRYQNQIHQWGESQWTLQLLISMTPEHLSKSDNKESGCHDWTWQPWFHLDDGRLGIVEAGSSLVCCGYGQHPLHAFQNMRWAWCHLGRNQGGIDLLLMECGLEVSLSVGRWLWECWGIWGGRSGWSLMLVVWEGGQRDRCEELIPGQGEHNTFQRIPVHPPTVLLGWDYFPVLCLDSINMNPKCNDILLWVSQQLDMPFSTKVFP